MKCSLCDKEATVRLTPDLDIGGIASCDEHKTEVWLDYYMFYYGNDRMIKKLNRKYGKNRVVGSQE